MVLITVIVCILFVFSLTDFIMPTNKRLHNQIYHIAFFITFFLFTIKYYYGADVINYYKFYKDIADPISIILQEPGTETPFEIGFVLFMSILKWINLSYWWMTALVSIIYFYAIYKLFNLIPSYKIVALLILVLLDYNLIFATHRQCLAVSFFILLFLSYLEKKYVRLVVYTILMIIMHKSSIFVIIPVLLFWNIRFNPTKLDFFICLVSFIIMSIVPLQYSLNMILENLPLNKEMNISVMHHLLFHIESKTITLLYSLILLVPCIYSIENTLFKKMSVILFCGAIFFTIFIQSNAILWRFRSFFLPFIIVYTLYIFSNIKDEKEVCINRLFSNYRSIVIICLLGLILLSNVYLYYGANKSMVSEPSRIYETCTIFDLIDRTEEEIREDRFERSSQYWKREFKYMDQVKQ